MARGRKKGVRITGKALDKARKKIQSTPKRGRWPKFAQIHSEDLTNYIFMSENPDKTFLHPKYGNICFGKTLHRGEDRVIDSNFGVVLPDEYKVISAIRFYCESYNKEEGWILDTCCRNTGIYEHPKIGCQRISCPYNKKGFICETLEKRTFEEDIVISLNKVYNDVQDSKNS